MRQKRELIEQRRDVIRTSPFVWVSGVLEDRAGQQRTLGAERVKDLHPDRVLSMPRGKDFG